MEELVEAAGRVLRSGRYINGEEVSAFEREQGAQCGVSYCVAVSTGLDALRLIFRAYMELGRLREGDEVIIPANTFIATFLAVADCGLKPVAADVEESGFCLDFERLPLSQRTRAVIPVHLFGNPCWDADVFDSLRSRGILIIEDNAQAIGACAAHEGFNGSRLTGNLGDAAAISYYPAKNIGACGDAGAVLTNDHLLADTVRMLANYGAKEKYYHELSGFNCRMDELQAAFLRIKLRRLEEVSAERNRRARLYDALITNPDVVKPLIFDDGRRQVWHQYVVRHPHRDELRKYLLGNGVSTEIHYPVPCHRQQCPASAQDVSLPVAERLASRILSLPVADPTDEEIHRISELINSFKLDGNQV